MQRGGVIAAGKTLCPTDLAGLGVEAAGDTACGGVIYGGYGRPAICSNDFLLFI